MVARYHGVCMKAENFRWLGRPSIIWMSPDVKQYLSLYLLRWLRLHWSANVDSLVYCNKQIIVTFFPQKVSVILGFLCCNIFNRNILLEFQGRQLQLQEAYPFVQFLLERKGNLQFVAINATLIYLIKWSV